VGEDVTRNRYSREQRQRYREKVRLCLDVFEELLHGDRISGQPGMTGMEIELNLVDDQFGPFFGNRSVLEEITDPAFQNELGSYNIEFNVDPHGIAGDGLSLLERHLRERLNAAEDRANRRGAHIVMVGVLPTLWLNRVEDIGWMTESVRYAALNDSVLAARGENIELDIEGPERLVTTASSLAPEAACTSTQLHLQVNPAEFSRVWNAAQVLAGPQVALGANSPFVFGRQLWQESRIELFGQSTDTRPPELRNQGVRPRVWFGERWITSVFDLFEENVRYFPALIPRMSQENPLDELAAGRVPLLTELRLHNGTIWRWNRPVYDVVDGEPHLRVENRVLPSGPTVVDILANAAFFHGTVRALADQDRPVWSKMTFTTAEENFREAARHGLDARVYWPGLGEVTMDELVLRRLLPLAADGLRTWGVAGPEIDRLLGIIEGRAKTGRNPATWQVDTVRELQRRGADRPEALTEMLRRYSEGMHANEPVHTWPLPGSSGNGFDAGC
jgi:gamma-glutamyl:cysteine ligase YbdK (ATP-grasp superfamily)